MTSAQKLPAIDQLREWFAANPGEVLTSDDVAERFGLSHNYASRLIKELVNDGHLKGMYCYGLNPERDR